MTDNRDLITQGQVRLAGWQNRKRIARLARQVAAHSRPDAKQPRVIIFNATARLTGLSLNAAFSQLVSWSLRLAGMPVTHFVCHSGMTHCVLGTNRLDYTTQPPCEACVAQSNRLYAGAMVQPFEYEIKPAFTTSLANLSVEDLSRFECITRISHSPIPLGALVLPSIRWALRRHTLPDDEATRYLLRAYIQSAYRVASQFDELIEQLKPAVGVIFNGMMYPEATARWVARQRSLRTVAHEVGFQQLSTFFTEGEPTAYHIQIPDDFELTPEKNAGLDAYLEKRFQGKFSMAGIQFWPEMHGLDSSLLEKISQFRQVVPVFTNVVYDTSQVHANVLFPHMFAWLDVILEIIRTHQDTLFVIRAHPDEMRIGTAKLSNESVQTWVEQNGVDQLPNVVFIDPTQYISSYELILQAKFVIVYNSSIGLEATLLGKTVVCGGKARYTQYPIVHFPQSISELIRHTDEMLQAEDIQLPAEFQRNARRFLYFQLYRASLPLDDYIEEVPRMGFVQLRAFSWEQLLPQNSLTMQVIADGILQGSPFLMPEN
jgi:hypothetical protein